MLPPLSSISCFTFSAQDYRDRQTDIQTERHTHRETVRHKEIDGNTVRQTATEEIKMHTSVSCTAASLLHFQLQLLHSETLRERETDTETDIQTKADTHTDKQD